MASVVLASFRVLLLVSGPWSGVAFVMVKSPSGSLLGDNTDNVTKFLGVPFANPPRRFEKAELVTPWSGVLDTIQQGDICFQLPNTNFLNYNESENCLLLDIYTPVNLENSQELNNKRAVMVWIHGGGFSLGSSRNIDGSQLAETGDVVVVVIQYRLGPFGFLYTGGLKPSNLGLWDQRLALEWIQANIHAFGGDKNKVTVFGNSAGAISVSAHLISPQVNNTLFQRAILQSGSVFFGDRTKTVRDSAAVTLAGLAGCSNASSTELAVDCLKDMPASEMNSVSAAIMSSEWPTADGDYLPVDALLLLEEYKTNGIAALKDQLGNLAQYDTLMGFNGEEGIFFLPNVVTLTGGLDDGVNDTVYRHGVQNKLLGRLVTDTDRQQELTKIVVSRYNGDEFAGSESRTVNEKNMRHLVDIAGDWLLKMPTYYTALFHSEAAPAKRSYFYLFDHKPAIVSPFDFGPDWLKTSANHADEIQFILPSSKTNRLSTKEKELSLALMTYWTNFAKTGDPKSEDNTARGGVKWEELSAEETNYMRFSLDKDELLEKPRGDRLEFILCIYWAAADLDNDPGNCIKEETVSAAFPRRDPKLVLVITFLSVLLFR